MPSRARGDEHPRVAEIGGAFARRDDDSARAVALLAAVEEVVGVGDDARGLVFLDRQRPPVHDGSGVPLRVGVGRHRHCAELRARRPELVHVPARIERVPLRRREQPERRQEGLRTPDRRAHRLRREPVTGPRPTEPKCLPLADRPVADDRRRDAGRDGDRGVVDDARGRVATTRIQVHESQVAESQRLCDRDRRGPFARVCAQSVDVGQLEPGVVDGADDREAAQLELGPRGTTGLRVLGLADAGDGSGIAEEVRHRHPLPDRAVDLELDDLVHARSRPRSAPRRCAAPWSGPRTRLVARRRRTEPAARRGCSVRPASVVDVGHVAVGHDLRVRRQLTGLLHGVERAALAGEDLLPLGEGPLGEERPP